MSTGKVRDAQAFDRDAIASFDPGVLTDSGRATFVDRALREETGLVVELQGVVIAYGVLEYTFFGNGFISMVYVAQGQRRRGVGRALMMAFADRCSTAKLFTSTNRSNRPMQSLLQSLGYIPSGIIENLDPDDPELVYFLDLSKRAV